MPIKRKLPNNQNQRKDGNVSSRRKRKEDSEEDELSDVERSHGNTHKFNKHRGKFDLSIILAQEEVDASKQNMLCWTSTKAGPSSEPLKPYCVVCGWPAHYKCIECTKKYPNSLSRHICSLKCFKLHKDSDCSKPINLLMW